MTYFEKDFILFFQELKKNNTKEWFDENRKRYEKNVKKPFANFVGTMIGRIRDFEPSLLIEPKECILRINRDIRFSKDKTPYNSHVTAFISKGGKKDKTRPGFFLRLTPDEIGIMIGCFQPDKTQLKKIRNFIAADPGLFSKTINDKKFKDRFGELKGEEHKRIPTEFKEAYSTEPLIARKQFYAVAVLDPNILLKEGLIEQLMEYYHAARPVNFYLTKAMEQPA
ncbi:MAG: DUF2461 domain-containing protein [Bacteroidota bacterium]